MERRLRVAPFVNRPTEVDPTLKDRLRREWPAILRWIIDGCLEWQRERLGTATVIKQASNKYFEEQDAFGRWLGERCIMDVMLSVRPGELYADYHTWCTANGEAPLSSSEFAEARDNTPGIIMKTINGSRWVKVCGFGQRTGRVGPIEGAGGCRHLAATSPARARARTRVREKFANAPHPPAPCSPLVHEAHRESPASLVQCRG
jgi:hypothetical protein